MSKLPKNNACKSNLSADSCNELHRAAAIAGLLLIYNKGQMPQKAIFQCMDKSFQGSVEKGYVAQIDQIIGGLSPFDSLFNKVTDVVTDASTNTSITTGFTLVWKPELSRSEQPIRDRRNRSIRKDII
jgi:hypothetical protein